MRLFKNKPFTKWAQKEGIDDHTLMIAINEIEHGLIDANLGGNVLKKRVSLTGSGKSSGVRTLLAYKEGSKAFFIYGFAKNARANITSDELIALKKLAKTLLAYSHKELAIATESGALIEVKNNG